MILLETLWLAAAGLVFLCYLGYAPTVLLLPGALGSLRWVALPWTGYAAFVVLAQFATQASLDMTATALLALALATAGNGLLLLRRRPPTVILTPPTVILSAAKNLNPSPTVILSAAKNLGLATLVNTRTGLVLCGVTAVVGLLGIAPLLVYGYHTIIGENWDGEIYLALGEYLRNFAQPHLADAPANPLLHTLLVPPYSQRTHGYSYFQAALGALTGLPSLVTLAPALSLLRALAVPATYFFYRTAWGWTPRPALLAAAALGLNPFLLWITYNTFGMQVPSLGLLPLSVAATLLALGQPLSHHGDTESRRRYSGLVAYAALVTAALAVTYHPALTAWAAIVGAGGLVLLVRSGRSWARVLLRGIGVVAGAAALSAVAQAMAFGGFLKQYADQPSGLGLTGFTAPTDALGLSLSFRSLIGAGPGQALLALAVRGYGLLVLVAGLVCTGLILLWAWDAARRVPVALATFAGGLVYMLLFLRPLDYPYGWFKAQSFVAFLLVGAVVGGLRATARFRLRGPIVLALAGALPSAALLLTLGLLLWQYHWPQRYSSEMMEAGQIRSYVAPGDSAFVSSSRLMPGRLFNGVLSYFLRDSQLYGSFSTANSAWDRTRPDGVYRWAVLPSRELPAPYGYRPEDRTWANSLLSLYRASPDLLYTSSWDRKGDYPQSTAATPLGFVVAPGSVLPEPAPMPDTPPVTRSLELGLAAFFTGTLDVDAVAGTKQTRLGTVQLAPGLQTLSLTIPAPSGIVLRPESGGNPLTVRWATLRTAPAGAAMSIAVALPLSDVLTLQIDSSAQGSDVRTTLRRVVTRAPARRADRVVLDVYRSPSTGNPNDHLAYWSFRLTGPDSAFIVPLAGGTPPTGPGIEPLLSASRLSPAAPGRYTASLTFYHGDTPLDTVTDIYGFTVGPQGIERVDVRRLPLLFY